MKTVAYFRYICIFYISNLFIIVFAVTFLFTTNSLKTHYESYTATAIMQHFSLVERPLAKEYMRVC